MAELLNEEEIGRRLSGLVDWSRDGDAITKTFERGDFVGSVEFAKSLVGPAEELNHHPDLEISWDKVTVSITNHAAGGLTAADFELASRIDAIA
jgi:4a-hydroxytetrahydrobiopterin dehydratase